MPRSREEVAELVMIATSAAIDLWGPDRETFAILYTNIVSKHPAGRKGVALLASHLLERSSNPAPDLSSESKFVSMLNVGEQLPEYSVLSSRHTTRSVYLLTSLTGV